MITIKPQSNYNASSSVQHLAAVPKQEQRSLERERGTRTPAAEEGFDRAHTDDHEKKEDYEFGPAQI